MPNPIKTLYDNYLFPHIIDCTCGMTQISKQREKVVPLAFGDVLEIGVGTGLNAHFYNKTTVNQVTGVDPHLNPKAIKRFAAAGIPLVSKPLSAENLPLANASIDSIVVTFTLCTIPRPQAALYEMARVLKPTGKLFYAEHGLAPNPTGMWQNRLNPLWKPVAGGCNLNRDIEKLLTSAGFMLENNHQGFVHDPKIAGYHYWGSARLG